MTGKELLEKRLTLALPQKEMADRMRVSLATYTRLEQNKGKHIPPRYEPAVEMIESRRFKELPKAELENQSGVLRHSYEERIKTRNQNKSRRTSQATIMAEEIGKAATAPKKKSAGDKKS